jgi:hypothetical protein
MRVFLFLIFMSFGTIVYGQSDINEGRKDLATVQYWGIYSFGGSPDSGACGQMTMYPETDSTVLFFIDIGNGPPSYNLGQMYARLYIKNGEGIYFTKEYGVNTCKWEVSIYKKILTIKTIKNCIDCGFGNGIAADHVFVKKKGNSKPEYFIDGHGNKIYFSETSPENYLR